MLFSEKQRHHPIRRFENLMLHFSRSRLCIKWHMADESLWYLSLSPCIMFFIVPNFQQLDLINPGKTQRAQGSLNNWSDWACSLAARLPNIQGNHNKIENTIYLCLLVCLCTSLCLSFVKLHHKINNVGGFFLIQILKQRVRMKAHWNTSEERPPRSFSVPYNTPTHTHTHLSFYRKTGKWKQGSPWEELWRVSVLGCETSRTQAISCFKSSVWRLVYKEES